MPSAQVGLTVRIYDDGTRIANANGGTSPTFDMLTIGLGGRNVFDSRRLGPDDKPSIAVILMGEPTVPAPRHDTAAG